MFFKRKPGPGAGGAKYYQAKKVRGVDNDFVSAVIVAAGVGTRMDGVDKLMLPLGVDGRPALVYTLTAFERCDIINEIIVVARDMEQIAGLVNEYNITKVTLVVSGGADRSESVRLGLDAMNPRAGYVAIHDGARPLVTPALIRNTVLEAKRANAAIAALPITDTVKNVDNGTIRSTQPRTGLYAAQTPQAFDAGLIKAALQNAYDKQLTLTDDAEAVETLGIPVSIVIGDRRNIKLTYPEDVITIRGFIDDYVVNKRVDSAGIKHND